MPIAVFRDERLPLPYPDNCFYTRTFRFRPLERKTMKKLTLKVKTREATGRGPMRRLRNTGYLPGVVYGESGTRHLQIKQTDFLPLLKQTLTSTAFVELQDEEGTCILSLIQEVQRNASTDQFYHIDFREITRGRPLNASVALHCWRGGRRDHSKRDTRSAYARN